MYSNGASVIKWLLQNIHVYVSNDTLQRKENGQVTECLSNFDSDK